MIGTSLTDKQRQLVRDLVALCQVSQHRSFRYTPAFNNHDTIEAKGTSNKINGSEKDLRTLEREGFITLRWIRHGAAEGTVSQTAIDAVRENFGLPPEAAAAEVQATFLGAPALAGSAAVFTPAAGAAHGGAAGDVPTLLAGLMADLAVTLRATLPADEAEAADADAAAITRQLRAGRPDVEVVARRTRSLVTRVGAATGIAADLAAKGGKFGEALQKLGQFVSLTGHWAAAHRARG